MWGFGSAVSTPLGSSFSDWRVGFKTRGLTANKTPPPFVWFTRPQRGHGPISGSPTEEEGVMTGRTCSISRPPCGEGLSTGPLRGLGVAGGRGDPIRALPVMASKSLKYQGTNWLWSPENWLWSGNKWFRIGFKWLRFHYPPCTKNVAPCGLAGRQMGSLCRITKKPENTKTPPPFPPPSRGRAIRRAVAFYSLHPCGMRWDRGATAPRKPIERLGRRYCPSTLSPPPGPCRAGA